MVAAAAAAAAVVAVATDDGAVVAAGAVVGWEISGEAGLSGSRFRWGERWEGE